MSKVFETDQNKTKKWLKQFDKKDLCGDIYVKFI